MRCHLGGALVAAGLESDDAVPALADLLVREVPLVLGGHLGPKGWAGVLRVLLSDPSQGVDTESNLHTVNVLLIGLIYNYLLT